MGRKKFADYLPYSAIVDDGIVVTKDGYLLRTFKVTPMDLGFAPDHVISQTLRSLNNSFRWMSGGWVVWVDAIRREHNRLRPMLRDDMPLAAYEFEAERRESLGTFFSTEFFVTLGFDVSKGRGGASSLLMQNKNTSQRRDDVRPDVFRFRQTTDDMGTMYETAFREARALGTEEQLSYFHGLWGRSYHRVRAPETPYYLDTYLADRKFTPDAVSYFGDEDIGKEFIQTASILDFPNETNAGMVVGLLRLPVEFRLSTRFEFLAKDKAKKEIKGIRQSHFQKRKGVGAILMETATHEQTELQDTEVLSNTQDASEALSTMSEGDMNFGYVTTSLILRSPSFAIGHKRLELLRKELNEQGFVTKEETMNNPLAFLGSLPGNVKDNPRKPMVSTRNLAHFFPMSHPWEGERGSPHLKEVLGDSVDYPHLVGKSGHDVFSLNLGVGDVGHTLVLGPTGAGKSILLNTLALQWMKYPGARVVFFDKDKSSEAACRNAGGQFFDLGAEDGSGMRLNPFSEIEEKEVRTWLSQFLVDYFRENGSVIGPKDQDELYECLESLQSNNPEHLNFTTFRENLQLPDLRPAIKPFIEGEYASLFTSGDDSIADNRWVTFEMSRLMNMGEQIVRFVVGYLFFKLTRQFDGTPTLLVLDEAWLFLDSPTFAAYLRDWLKTLRKKNVYVILATQEMADAKSTIFSTIVNACLTKIMLPNQQAEQSDNAALYQEVGLAYSDIEALRDGVPKRDYLYVSSKGKQMFQLGLGPRQISILKEARPHAYVRAQQDEAELVLA